MVKLAFLLTVEGLAEHHQIFEEDEQGNSHLGARPRQRRQDDHPEGAVERGHLLDHADARLQYQEPLARGLQVERVGRRRAEGAAELLVQLLRQHERPDLRGRLRRQEENEGEWTGDAEAP